MDSESLLEQERPKRDLLRWVPLIGLCVSIYSAIFATAVLFPWHFKLSHEFSELKNNCFPNFQTNQ